MSSNSNCSAPGCNSVYRNNPELTFHHFPNDGQTILHVDEFGIISTVHRKRMWEIKVKMVKPVTKNIRICSKHFEDEDFITPGDWGYKKRYLKKTAVPSKNLPASSITTKSRNYKQEQRNKRLEPLTKRRQINQLSCTSNIQQKTNTFSDVDGAKALLELGNIHQNEVAVGDDFNPLEIKLEQEELVFKDEAKEVAEECSSFVNIKCETNPSDLIANEEINLFNYVDSNSFEIKLEQEELVIKKQESKEVSEVEDQIAQESSTSNFDQVTIQSEVSTLNKHMLAHKTVS